MNIETIWSEFLTLLREEAGSRVVDTWFQALSVASWDAPHQTVRVRAPNTFVKDWVTTHHHDIMLRLMSRVLQSGDLKILLFTDDEVARPLQQKSPSNVALTEAVAIVPAVRAPVMKPRDKSPKQEQSLNLAYRFDTFIVGSHNSLAYAAANAIVDKLGVLYNPFFVYGKSGLGKTHLLHAIGNAVRERGARPRILYQSANRFVADFINAIRFDKVYQFEAQYKNADLLLIDDVQFLANKEQTQEAFFHLFNTLHDAKRQIVCTCDSLPGDIAGFADRVRSRLVSGLVTDISEPTIETIIAIVKRKAEAQGHYVSDDVAESIALVGSCNIRDIEGALIRVFAYASLTKSDVTVELARAALARSKTYERPILDMMRIAECVARHFEFSLDVLRAHSRHKKIVYARHIAMFLMKRMTEYSLREIGRYVQHRDHSTVMYAIAKIERLQHDDGETRRVLQLLERRLLS